MSLEVRQFDESEHKGPLVDLWGEVFNYNTDRNDPGVSIDKKIAIDDLIFVAVINREVVGSIMAGYDGHRGWIYSLAVSSDFRKKGVGSALLDHAESCLSKLGCMKINLQILVDNKEIVSFYKNRGYLTEQRISMGKELPHNIPNKQE